MKKIVFILTVSLFFSFKVFSQTNQIIISNSVADVEYHDNFKKVKCYFTGVLSSYNNFIADLNKVEGITVGFSKTIEFPNKLVYAVVKIDNRFNKPFLVKLLKKYQISHIIVDGKKTTIEDYFKLYQKQDGVIKTY